MIHTLEITPQPISAPEYNARALLGVPAVKICRALQFTKQANFDKRFRTNLLETYKIHIFIRKNILSNFVSVELEQGERLGGEPVITAKELPPGCSFLRQHHNEFTCGAPSTSRLRT